MACLTRRKRQIVKGGPWFFVSDMNGERAYKSGDQGGTLSSWVDECSMLEFVGCGRCITCFPVWIDLTEEVHALVQL